METIENIILTIKELLILESNKVERSKQKLLKDFDLLYYGLVNKKDIRIKEKFFQVSSAISNREFTKAVVLLDELNEIYKSAK